MSGLAPVVLITIAARSGSLGTFDDESFAALATVAATTGAAVAHVAVRTLARRVAQDPAGDTSAVWGAAAAGVGVHALGQTLVPIVILATIGLSEDESVQPAMGAIEAAWALGQLTAIAAALAVGRVVAGPVARRRRPPADAQPVDG